MRALKDSNKSFRPRMWALKDSKKSFRPRMWALKDSKKALQTGGGGRVGETLNPKTLNPKP